MRPPCFHASSSFGRRCRSRSVAPYTHTHTHRHTDTSRHTQREGCIYKNTALSATHAPTRTCLAFPCPILTLRTLGCGTDVGGCRPQQARKFPLDDEPRPLAAALYDAAALALWACRSKPVPVDALL
jgi:hypothetical protein